MAYVPPHTGAFRHLVRIERKATGKDAYGNPVNAWSTLPGLETIRAAVTAQRGGEEVRSMRASGIDGFDVVLRIPNANINVGDRMIDHDGAAYDIQWIGDLEGRGRQINLSAQLGGLND
jgi:head-tail adaptor